MEPKLTFKQWVNKLSSEPKGVLLSELLSTTGNHTIFIGPKAGCSLNPNVIIGITSSNNNYLDNMAVGYGEIPKPTEPEPETGIIKKILEFFKIK